MVVARFIGADEVIAQYRKIEKPCFSMWCKSAVVCQYNGNDLDEGAELIKEEIERNVKRGFGHECFLKIHPDSQKNYTQKSDVYYNIVFKSMPDVLPMVGGDAFQYAVMQQLNSINSRMNAYEEMTDGDDDDDDDDGDDDDDQQGQADGVNGMLAGIDRLLAHPIVSRLIEKIMEGGAQPAKKQLAALAGTDDVEQQQQQLTKAIEVLLNKGVTVEHFVKLAKMPKEKIVSLLNFL